ncbi:MAG TPA: hypothetical protein VIB61_03020 [Microbacteriaceae bacterium]
MAKFLPQRILALASFGFVLVMNAVATALPLSGLSVGAVSRRYDTLFAPIDFTFGIWGLIYLGLTVYSLTQLAMDTEVIRAITPWFMVANLLNGSWIIAWRLELLWLSALILALLLFCLFRINQVTTAKRTDLASTLSVRLPFAIYFGWVTVATIANISSLLVQLGFAEGIFLSAQTWTVVVLVVAVSIGATTAIKNSSPAYSLVLVWAFWGIYSRHMAATEWNQQYPAIILAVQILLPVLVLVSIGALVKWLRQPVDAGVPIQAQGS